jgi:hypothetical protein
MSNNNEEILKFLGICVVVGVLVFYGVNFLKLQAQVLEGATNMSDSNTSLSSTNGIGGNASQYNATLKAEVIKMQDTLLIPKYRAEYENSILNLDDYLNLAMLKTALSINLTNEIEPGKPNPNIALLSSLKVLSDAKSTLNSSMKYLDTH